MSVRKPSRGPAHERGAFVSAVWRNELSKMFPSDAGFPRRHSVAFAGRSGP